MSAKHNMIEGQIRPLGVTQNTILNAIRDVARENFVPENATKFAYSEANIPVKTKGDTIRYIMNPPALARIIQSLDIRPNHIILDIACAKGYSTAVIAQIAESVVAIEDDPALAQDAQKNLEDNDINNAVIIKQKLTQGYPQGAPYDAICINGAVQAIPQKLVEQIKDNGKIALIAKNPNHMPIKKNNRFIIENNTHTHAATKAVIYRKYQKSLTKTDLFDANMPHITEFNLNHEEFIF